MKKVSLFTLVIMLSIAACSPKSAPTTTAPVSAGMPELANISATEADVTAGHTLFTTKCTKCHKAKDKYVSEHSYSEAIRVLNSMVKKAKLNQDEISQLAAYVNSAAKK
ncbi:MAG TPA: hypothetical protein PLS07_04470 [Niabella sp.]|nr:hypothetical protein [Niabella sp.]HQW14223.1 hypothetical protein [Niabella sp.]HQX19623.1 hypothetical protein [Niabella sp.]HQX39943.1 hypothetical protein [Niabella sp.]HRB06936.1 hypothetical protein [Niabella sp.]